MRSTFKRGPGSGFGLSNLKPPHTLTNEENETVIEGGAALLLGSLRLALGVAHPYLEYAAAIRLPPRIGDTSVSPIRGRSPATHDCPRQTHLSDGAAPEFRGRPLCFQGLWTRLVKLNIPAL